MPFYDLRCPSCDKEFNIPASAADKKAKRIPCPECGSRDLQTVYKGAPAYIKTTTSKSKSAAADCPNRRVCGAGCPNAK